MKRAKKAVLIIGQVLSLIMGDNFTTPLLQVMERYPFLRFGH